MAQRPHIGTDELRRVLVGMRAALTRLGAEIRFETRLTGLILREGTGDRRAFSTPPARRRNRLRTPYAWPSATARATPTNGSRALGLPMQQKLLAIGARIRASAAQYRPGAVRPLSGASGASPAEYKLNAPTPDGRGVYTFCMCPGGQVINASSEPRRRKRQRHEPARARRAQRQRGRAGRGSGRRISAATIPLAGMYLQRRIEQAASAAPGRRVSRAPATGAWAIFSPAGPASRLAAWSPPICPA